MSKTHTFKGSGMGMTNYFIDTFVGYKMSEITFCGAPNMEDEDKKWLNSFILNAALCVNIAPEEKAYLFNFVRRIEGAFSVYHEARKSLIEHIETPNNTISPYFRSLVNFEMCVSQLVFI